MIRLGSDALKGYSGRVGGQFILMLNGLITVFVNWVLLVIVMVMFTPVVFIGPATLDLNVFYYFVIVTHFAATTVLGLSMLFRSMMCPYADLEHHLQMQLQERFIQED